MANTLMPWSVKGVSDEARAIAKARAQESGQTIGAWLSDLIVAAGEDITGQFHQSLQALRAAAGDGSALQDVAAIKQKNAELAQLVLALAHKLSSLEKDALDFAGSFQDQLSELRVQMNMQREFKQTV